MATNRKDAPAEPDAVPHKHLRLHNRFVTMIPDDDGAMREVVEHHGAEFDVPVDQLEEVLADARQRWVDIEVSDECPDHCTAQLARPGA